MICTKLLVSRSGKGEAEESLILREVINQVSIFRTILPPFLNFIDYPFPNLIQKYLVNFNSKYKLLQD